MKALVKIKLNSRRDEQIRCSFDNGEDRKKLKS